MFKKPIFLFITTFIIAIVLAFFSSYFIVQKVHGDVGFGSDINMLGNKILNVGEGVYSFDAINLGQFNSSARLCLKGGGSKGDDSFCITSWCDINDFSFCGGQDDFYPFGGGGVDPCFTAKTRILMADNTYKNIADIQPGDYVLTRESENSPKLVKAKVSNTYEHWYDGYLVIINGYLEVTPNHAMFVNGEWKQVRDIEIGDRLFNKDNQKVVVESMEKRIREKEFKVYNLGIEKYKTYFAGEFYVHNLLKAD